MKRMSLRFFVALVTFFIGTIAVSIWFFNNYTNLETISVDVPTAEKKFAAVDPSPISTVNEDYAVYSTIINGKQYNDEVIVVNDYTSHGLLANVSNLNRETFGLTEDIINDYQAKNEENQELENNFSVGNKVIFISEKEESQLFRKGQAGWTKFYKKYPKAERMISFSRVGFNQERTQALVNVSMSCGWLCGEGSFVLLQKENGKWIILRDIGLWVS